MNVSNSKWLAGVLVLAAWLMGGGMTWGQTEGVKVTGGEVEGRRIGQVASYKGIPFAAPPVGSLRWKPPQPITPWEGVRKATEFAASPMQGKVAVLFGSPANFSEDCLYLNVWTPATNAGEKLPVMVWIYGGAFAWGSTAMPLYDGTHLARKGVVVVSITYRVGAFGFLAHPELTQEGSKGNFGILDQIAGLKWVRENIAAFGGDPGRVTIFGESAGGQSVALLVTSPKAKGLFQGAIAESGAMTPQKKLDSAEKQGVAFLAGLGAKDLAAARALPAKKILDAGFQAGPTADEESFAGEPYRCLQEGKANETPILVGFNSDDGALLVRGSREPAEFIDSVHKTFGKQEEKVLALYPHADTKEATHAAKDIARDVGFAWPVWNWARIQAERGTNAAFVYVFDQHGFWQPDGAAHGAEISYVFDNLNSLSSEDAALAKRMSGYWVNFAKTGNPNGSGLPKWSPFTATNHDFMIFNETTRMAPVPGLSRIQALDAEMEGFWRKWPN